jgi:hypothetical protein
MNCSFCNAKTRNRKEDYFHKSKIIGEVLVPAIEFKECQGCGEVTLSPEAKNEVKIYVAEQELNAISTLPVNDLISAGQAANILGVTKQAFSKNSKFKKGFVYSIMIGAKKAYFRSSIDLFKRTGDGRFPITRWKSSVPENAILTYSPVDRKCQKVVCQTDIAADAAHSWNESPRVKQ